MSPVDVSLKCHLNFSTSQIFVFAQRWLRAPTAHAVSAQCFNSRTTTERPALSLTNCPTAFRVMGAKQGLQLRSLGCLRLRPSISMSMCTIRRMASFLELLEYWATGLGEKQPVAPPGSVSSSLESLVQLIEKPRLFHPRLRKGMNAATSHWSSTTVRQSWLRNFAPLAPR
jgi:hypothetical protein